LPACGGIDTRVLYRIIVDKKRTDRRVPGNFLRFFSAGGAPRGRLFQKRLERKERICYNTFIYANRPVRRSAWQKFSKNSRENFEI